ncbi:D,D-heptose 1,7-bisphosphate phosphatase [Geothrix limicola]|uniref:D,D-heptose 1,7-bisphosphate phosphatase n=1 Tax=Geothrix limicola TaxID=2927978 RepID=A0ABQ5QFH2_9BACT|nr:HAD family hydrolase [Geothrix limicola]GLH73176.1 D,D-heptose 1,7-bisphosphate phosphatase [Geothrix limicola]
MGIRRRAVFLDRDGVLVEDRGLLVDAEDIRIYEGVPEALARLHRAGFALVVVSNQAVVARGLLSEAGMRRLQETLEARLQAQGAPAFDGFYYCPHHPSATLPEYRVDCGCRKPRPGMLLKAAEDLGLDLASSYMVGDRPTDLQAGHRAGCLGIWVQSGRHADRPIETAEALDPGIVPAFVCASLTEAATWILEER